METSPSLDKEILRELEFTDQDVLYRQVCDGLRREIQRGHLPPGTKLPSAFFSDCRHPNTVDVRIEALLLDAVRRMAGTRAKRLAIVTHVRPNPKARPGSFERSLSDTVPAACDKAGIEMIRTPYEGSEITGRDHTPTELEELGFIQFAKLWASRKRPDAIIAYPSTVARGLTTAVKCKCATESGKPTILPNTATRRFYPDKRTGSNSH